MLVAAAAAFGLAGLCGVIFSALAVPGLLVYRAEDLNVTALLVGLPCLFIGGGMAWWCMRLLLRMTRSDC